MHPDLTNMVAKARLDDLYRQAERSRRGRVRTRRVGRYAPARKVRDLVTSGRLVRVSGYGAAVLAIASAAVSLYWTLGGTALLSTVGPEFLQVARNPSPAVVAAGMLLVIVKSVAGILPLALVHSWGRLRLRLVSRVALLGGLGLTVYGGALVVLGALVLSGIYTPTGAVDTTALRWHVYVWDLWFLVWGVLLTTVAHRSAPPAR